MNIQKKETCKSKGFTLIELAIAIAIVSIVTALAVGSYMSWKPGYLSRGAVSQIRNDLSQAKIRAVETRRQCRVVFTMNGYQLEDGDRVMNTSAWGNIDSNGNFTGGTPFRIRNFNEFPLVTITQNDGSPITSSTEPTVVFSPRGTAVNDSLGVKYSNNLIATVDVGITGRINITWL